MLNMHKLVLQEPCIGDIKYLYNVDALVKLIFCCALPSENSVKDKVVFLRVPRKSTSINPSFSISIVAFFKSTGAVMFILNEVRLLRLSYPSVNITELTVSRLNVVESLNLYFLNVLM